MSHFSRRSLLGYSGSAAAGAVLASGGTAQAATTVGASAESEAAAVDFPGGTEFSGMVRMPDTESTELTFSFTVSAAEAPAAQRITALEVANALNELAATRGWPPITFYGTPAPAPLN
ncbi:hypothetical protein [Streptomyces sp. DSM 40750]|uniref:hypothetical protein n=1 Tax=Streptomyces sp. DSM 40750 TaxID=2801030 RepID=UPI00214C1F16|nr:hypothetical protein [Streptomyces sp. DSM 40750]UUU20455.1 hypothetical protein JIX55_09120 [Streptomyces sp. DSM 40750]